MALSQSDSFSRLKKNGVVVIRFLPSIQLYINSTSARPLGHCELQDDSFNLNNLIYHACAIRNTQYAIRNTQ